MSRRSEENYSASSDSESDHSISNEQSDSVDQHSPVEVSDSLQLKDDYATFDDLDQAIKRYGAATFQTFIKRRSEALPRGHALEKTVVYRKVQYECVHHEQYKSKGSGKRAIQHSRRKGCSARIIVYAHLRRKVLHVSQVNVTHNHQLSEGVWQNLPENRRLSNVEAETVLSLVQSNVPTAAIKKQVSKQVKKSITTQDVANIRNKHDIKQRAGRSEEEMINHVLAEYQISDPNLFVDITATESGNDLFSCWYGSFIRLSKVVSLL